MRIKICGIKNFDDAFFCIDEGVDALGFVFYKKSPRYISPKNARDIIKKLPPFVKTYGLFVNESVSYINEIMRFSLCDIAQIHFDLEDSFYSTLQSKYLKVVRLKDENDLLNLDKKSYYLIDSFSDNYGGSGTKNNLEYFKNKDCSKFIIAGGIDINSLNELKDYNFLGLDLSSSLESKKGVKSKDKIRDFMNEVKKFW